MTAQESVEITKFTVPLLMESITAMLLENSFDKGDGTLCVVTDLRQNYEQGIINIELSDKSSFSIKIR